MDCSYYVGKEGVSENTQPLMPPDIRGPIANKGSRFLFTFARPIPSKAGHIQECAKKDASGNWFVMNTDSIVSLIDPDRSNKYVLNWQQSVPDIFHRYRFQKKEIDSLIQIFQLSIDSSMIRVQVSELDRFIQIFEKDSAGRVVSFENWVKPQIIRPDDTTGLYYLDTTGLGYYFTPDKNERDTAWVIHRIYYRWTNRFIAQIKGITYRVSKNGALKVSDERWFLLSQRIRIKKLPPCYSVYEGSKCSE